MNVKCGGVSGNSAHPGGGSPGNKKWEGEALMWEWDVGEKGKREKYQLHFLSPRPMIGNCCSTLSISEPE